MKDQLLGGLNTSSGLPYRRINFVVGQRADAHCIPPSVDLRPLNEPPQVGSRELHGKVHACVFDVQVTVMLLRAADGPSCSHHAGSQRHGERSSDPEGVLQGELDTVEMEKRNAFGKLRKVHPCKLFLRSRVSPVLLLRCRAFTGCL